MKSRPHSAGYRLLAKRTGDKMMFYNYGEEQIVFVATIMSMSHLKCAKEAENGEN